MGKIARQKLIWPALGGALAALCGLLLWQMPLAAPWTNASYDYLFRFGSRAVTNNVALILMDNQAYEHFDQVRGQWDRALHAQLLNKLADDGSSMVVIDSFFRAPRDPASDETLAAAMRRLTNVVLLADQAEVIHPHFTGVEAVPPTPMLLAAARANWGVGRWDPDTDRIVRRHWPFPSPGPYPSPAWKAAQLSGASLSSTPQERWLRYYGDPGPWAQMSYEFALNMPTNYFRGKIVFIGAKPESLLPEESADKDKFSTPFTRWTDEAKGGVEIIITQYLNLMNGDWLCRPPAWLENLILVVTGILAGAGFCRLRFRMAIIAAAAICVTFSLAAVSWSYFTNYWFPWLIVSGGQIPVALAWAGVLRLREALQAGKTKEEPLPETPGFELFQPPFGKGAYGNVWLAKNAAGQWLALKVIYLKHFNGDSAPYEREFNGVTRYKRVSDKHPGLLRVDFVSQKSDGYFFYAMELGDSLTADWQYEPATYKPRDLGGERARSPGRRLPNADCIRIAIALTDALTFLHDQGLTHRDIKPSNVIFVNGQPKLADLGLIAEIRPDDVTKTFVGTPGYMPPPPEPPGTPIADIYALGMLLYVISTGNSAGFFPEIATTLVNTNEPGPYLALNAIILKACQPDSTKRYQSATEMEAALRSLDENLQKSKLQ